MQIRKQFCAVACVFMNALSFRFLLLKVKYSEAVDDPFPVCDVLLSMVLSVSEAALSRWSVI